jgi:polysaccharide export outer membrane protein
MRVFDAITLAGGFRPFSSKNNVKVIRLKPDGTSQEFRFNYDSFVRGSNLEQNVLLLPGDRIIVPQESPFLFR